MKIAELSIIDLHYLCMVGIALGQKTKDPDKRSVAQPKLIIPLLYAL